MKQRSITLSRNVVAGIALLLATAGLQLAQAAGYTWDGDSDGSWSTGANWNPDGTPANANTSTLTFSSTSGIGTTLNTGTFNAIGTLTFDASTLAYTIDQGVGGTLTLSGGIQQLGAQTITFNNGMTLSGATAMNVSLANGALLLAGNLYGSGSLTKSGSGTLTLSGANSYTGTTTISAGTLELTAGGSLATTGTLTFSGSGTFSLAGSQSLANIAVANNMTGTVTGGGGLTVTGASFVVGSATANTTQTLNLSGLGSFTYNNSGGAFSVGGRVTGASTRSIGALTLPNNSTITASSFNVATVANGNNSGVVNSTNVGTLTLSGATTINTGTIQLGTTQANGTLQYATGTANPTLTLRATNGTGSVSTMTIGWSSEGPNGYTNSSTVDLVTGVTGTSTLNALVGTLTIGQYNRTTVNGSGTSNGTFIMGAGTLTATTMVLGLSSGTYNTAAVNGTFTSGAGGTVNVGTLTIGDKTTTTTGTANVKGTFNLNGGADLYATTIQPGGNGTSGGTVTRTFNWNNGTIHNLAGTDLTISSGLTLTMASGATHAFDIENGQTGTISAVIAGDASQALTKTGLGTLILTGANTYTGGTTINAGALVAGVNNALGTFSTGGSGTLTMSGTGVLDLNGKTVSVGALTGSAGTITGSGGGTLTVGGTITTAAAYSGVIQDGSGGSVQLIKSGSGLLTLSGANTYTGGTTVSGGTLKVNNTGATVGLVGGVTVSSGAYLGGTGTISGLATINSGGHLAPGNSIGTLNMGSLTLNAGANLDFEFASSNQSDSIVLGGGAGTLTLNGASTLNLLAVGGGALISPVAGTYNLIQYGALTLQNGGTLTLSNTIAGYSYTLTWPATSGWLTLDISNPEWIRTTQTTGDWSDGSNWSTAPATGSLVNFGTVGSYGSVNLNVNASVAGLTFRSAVGTTISGSSSLTLANGGNPATVSVLGNTHTINTSVYLSDNASITVDAGGLTIGGTISGASGKGIIKSGNGALTLSGNNTYTGGTMLDAGILNVGTASALGDSTSALTVNGGTLDINGHSIIVGTLSGSGGAITDNSSGSGTTTLTANQGSSTILSAMIQDGATKTLALTKNGIGDLTLSGNNTYSGTTTINSGNLIVSGGSAIPDTGRVIISSVNSAYLTLSQSETIGSLEGGGGTNPFGVDLGGNTLTTGGNNADTTFAGILANSGTITKTGTGTWTLTGNSTGYGTWTMDVAAGKVINNGTFDSSTTVNVTGGTLGGTGTVGAVTLSPNGYLSPGNSPGVMTMGSLDLSGGVTNGALQFELDTPSTSDRIDVAGALNIGSGLLGFTNFQFTALGGLTNDVYTLITSGGLLLGTSLNPSDLSGLVGVYTGTLSTDGSNIFLTLAIPEPSTWVLVGIALLPLMLRRRRKA